ncbi:hypothetical protein ACIQ7Q_06070 [Streptomyces sp. NPDC096176]|uniref:hypothetical protein n=1 Tax=Streptomyces sp. NPDC096176 TaxID=3366079 RepID=UPI003818FEF3
MGAAPRPGAPHNEVVAAVGVRMRREPATEAAAAVAAVAAAEATTDPEAMVVRRGRSG